MAGASVMLVAGALVLVTVGALLIARRLEMKANVYRQLMVARGRWDFASLASVIATPKLSKGLSQDTPAARGAAPRMMPASAPLAAAPVQVTAATTDVERARSLAAQDPAKAARILTAWLLGGAVGRGPFSDGDPHAVSNRETEGKSHASA